MYLNKRKKAERDSNPRRLFTQRFFHWILRARPPHSTALPSLRGKNKACTISIKISFDKGSFLRTYFFDTSETGFSSIKFSDKIYWRKKYPSFKIQHSI